MSDFAEFKVRLDQDEVLEFCGPKDRNIRKLEENFEAKIIARGNQIHIKGEVDEVERAARVIDELRKIYQRQGKINQQEVRFAIERAKVDIEKLAPVITKKTAIRTQRREIYPQTPGQRQYVEKIDNSDIVFGIGPAGTGKTYLAVAMAVSHLLKGDVSRIILVRPAVEAGEKLGFLPGDLAAKIDPYLRPLYDALYDMLDPERIRDYISNTIIEIAPLAFMRGRTLNSAFVILDEAQNTTNDQMKMFLTRLGFDSKAVITGDITQIDLAQPKSSGLIGVKDILRNIEGIEFNFFSERDVVRHSLVQKIIRAYEGYNEEEIIS